MKISWSPAELVQIGRSEELEMTTYHPDGTAKAAVPIWAVCAGQQVYVRSWHRRDTGWFGRAVASGRARISVQDLQVDVTVEDLGAEDAQLCEIVDEAYRTKYGRSDDASVSGMVTREAAASTLRLLPVRGTTE